MLLRGQRPAPAQRQALLAFAAAGSCRAGSASTRPCGPRRPDDRRTIRWSCACACRKASAWPPVHRCDHLHGRVPFEQPAAIDRDSAETRLRLSPDGPRAEVIASPGCAGADARVRPGARVRGHRSPACLRWSLSFGVLPVSLGRSPVPSQCALSSHYEVERAENVISSSGNGEVWRATERPRLACLRVAHFLVRAVSRRCPGHGR